MDDKKHFGVAVAHDGKELSDIKMQAALEDDSDRLFFARFDAKAMQGAVGAVTRHSKGNTKYAHSYEVAWLNQEKGFQEMPVALSAGGKYKLTDAVRFLYTVKASQHWSAYAKWKYTLDDKWEFSARQQYLTEHHGSKERNPYDLGLQIKYRL